MHEKNFKYEIFQYVNFDKLNSKLREKNNKKLLNLYREFIRTFVVIVSSRYKKK